MTSLSLEGVREEMVKLRRVGGVGISQAKWRAVWSGGWGSVIGRGRAHSKAWRV